MSAGMCFCGICPSVPPSARERFQFETRVRCTPAALATVDTPPSFVMIESAGSINPICSDIRYEIKSPVANWETEPVAEPRYAFWMSSPAMVRWLKEALKFSGLSQSALAGHLTKKLGRSIDRAAVNKMTKNSRDIKADEAF